MDIFSGNIDAMQPCRDALQPSKDAQHTCIDALQVCRLVEPGDILFLQLTDLFYHAILILLHVQKHFNIEKQRLAS